MKNTVNSGFGKCHDSYFSSFPGTWLGKRGYSGTNRQFSEKNLLLVTGHQLTFVSLFTC